MTQCVAYLILTKSFVLISALQKIIQLSSQITSSIFVAKTVFVDMGYCLLSCMLTYGFSSLLPALVNQFYLNYNRSVS